MTNSRLFTGMMVLAGILAATFIASGAQAQTRLILSHHVPTTHIIHKTAQRFADAVEKGTNGEITIDIRPAGQMFGMEQAVDALNLGTLDFAWGNISALQKWEPAIGFASMPFLFDDSEHAKRAFYGELGQRVHDDVLSLSGVDILAFGNAGFRVLVTKAPVTSAGDVDGMKLRVPNIAAYVDMASSLGANPTPMSASEVYTALQTGVIDGMESPADYFTSVQIWEVADYAARTNHIFTAGAIMASSSTMSRLTDEQQQIIRDAAQEAVGEWMWSQVQETQAAAWAEMSEHMEVVDEPDRESFRQATAGVTARFVEEAGPPAGDYVEAVRSLR